MIAPLFRIKKLIRGRWWPRWLHRLFPVKPPELFPAASSASPSEEADQDVSDDLFDDLWGERRRVEAAPDRRCRRGNHEYDDPEPTLYTSPTPVGHMFGKLSTVQQWRTCQRPGCGNRMRRFRDRIPNGKGFDPGPWKQFP